MPTWIVSDLVWTVVWGLPPDCGLDLGGRNMIGRLLAFL